MLSLVLSIFFGAGLGGDTSCACWFVKNLHHVLLKSLFFKEKTVLVPYEVGGFGIECVSLHAALEEGKYVAVVGVGGK